MENISVIGAGTMGNGIAHVFAHKGFRVSLIDSQPQQLEKALKTIAANLDRQISKGTLAPTDKERTLANIAAFSTIPEGIAHADLVVEAATENTEIKLN
ncbi:MAG TPA: 3-hydroxyacyl-CoA dehydrogenase NAD-binding domain-containing protein, partial [Puia sp.]|nr:3-hydroxyacyl-CoA dehydrogenase NAD-binding domain-containing protein [Puia sp.]